MIVSDESVAINEMHLLYDIAERSGRRKRLSPQAPMELMAIRMDSPTRG